MQCINKKQYKNLYSCITWTVTTQNAYSKFILLNKESYFVVPFNRFCWQFQRVLFCCLSLRAPALMSSQSMESIFARLLIPDNETIRQVNLNLNTVSLKCRLGDCRATSRLQASFHHPKSLWSARRLSEPSGSYCPLCQIVQCVCGSTGNMLQCCWGRD